MGKALDLTGRRFGRLVAVEKTDKIKGERINWRCVCDCGNECYVRTDHLNLNLVISCGCYQKETRYKNGKKSTKFLISDVILNTNAKLLNSKIRTNNKSGFTGVCWDKYANSWKTTITFRKHNYSLGNFKNLSDAAAARKQAEENLFGNFLKWYEEYKKNGVADVVKRAD